MKPVLIFILLITYSFHAFPQGGAAIVEDPGAIAQLIENLKIATDSYEKLKEQTKFLEDARKALTAVSTSVRTFVVLDQMIKMQYQLIIDAEKNMSDKRASKLFTAKELNNMVTQYTSISEQATAAVKMANQYLEDNVFKMSDSERLTHLNESFETVKSSKSEVEIIDARYEKMKQRKLLRQAFFIKQ